MPETNSPTINISQAEIESLEQFYTFREREKVLSFLNDHAFLIPLLLTGQEKLKPYFPDATLFLEVSTDPEIIGDTSLIASVATSFSIKKALKKEEQFDRDWWFKVWDQANDKLHFFTEKK